jgi:hypothetical protein
MAVGVVALTIGELLWTDGARVAKLIASVDVVGIDSTRFVFCFSGGMAPQLGKMINPRSMIV